MIALDTNIFIYALTMHPEFGAAARDLLARGKTTPLVASVAVIGELLGTARNDHPHELAQATLMLKKLRGLQLVAADEATLYEAVKLMQSHSGLKLLDAIHVATALGAGASEFWTNDKQIARLKKVGHLAIRPLA